MMHQLTHSAAYNLSQLLDVMQGTRSDQYAASLPVLFGSSIGMHVRHIIEFYQCLLLSENSGTIHYDGRERNQRIECDLTYARDVIKICIGKLQNLSDDKELILLTSQALSGHTIQIPTSLLRELTYLIEHSIHHMAIVKMAYAQNFPSVEIPPHFGVAYSTLKYQQLVHSNIPSAQ